MLSEVCKDRIIKSKLKNIFYTLSEGTLGIGWTSIYKSIQIPYLPFTSSNVMMYQQTHLTNKEGQLTHGTFCTMNVIDVSPPTPRLPNLLWFTNALPSQSYLLLISPTSSPAQFLHSAMKFYTDPIPLPLMPPCFLPIANPHFSFSSQLRSCFPRKSPLTLMLPLPLPLRVSQHPAYPMCHLF